MTEKRAIFAGFILMLIIYLINGNVLITYGIEFDSNGTTVVWCFGTDWMRTWNEVFFQLIVLLMYKKFDFFIF